MDYKFCDRCGARAKPVAAVSSTKSSVAQQAGNEEKQASSADTAPDSLDAKERQKAERLEKLRLAKERAGARASSSSVAIPTATKPASSVLGNELADALFIVDGGDARRAAAFEEFLNGRQAGEVARFLRAAVAYQRETRTDARRALAQEMWSVYICAESANHTAAADWDGPAVANTLNLPVAMRTAVQVGLADASPRLFDQVVAEIVNLMSINRFDVAFEAHEREQARAGAGAFRVLQVELVGKVFALLPFASALRLRRVSRFFRDLIGSAHHWQLRARLDGIDCRALDANSYVRGRAACTAWGAVDHANVEVVGSTSVDIVGGQASAGVLLQARLPLLPLCFEPATYYFEFSARGVDAMHGRIGLARRGSDEVFGVAFQGTEFSEHQSHPSDISPL